MPSLRDAILWQHAARFLHSQPAVASGERDPLASSADASVNARDSTTASTGGPVSEAVSDASEESLETSVEKDASSMLLATSAAVSEAPSASAPDGAAVTPPPHPMFNAAASAKKAALGCPAGMGIEQRSIWPVRQTSNALRRRSPRHLL
jgi:hypothetical protein